VLKRYQVLLPDWLEEYIKYLADTYDLSFSEVIRAEICIAIIGTISKLHPEYKLGITSEEILDMIKKAVQEDTASDKQHGILSKIYFETRKAIEYRFNQEKKQKKK
jgi:isopropylmalate/homocitrate/citramalate synthase